MTKTKVTVTLTREVCLVKHRRSILEYGTENLFILPREL